MIYLLARTSAAVRLGGFATALTAVRTLAAFDFSFLPPGDRLLPPFSTSTLSEQRADG
jgi:hypothetical protein